MTTTTRTSITYDPVYYVTVAFYALLTTILPMVLGWPNLLPIFQALALTVFMAIPLTRRHHAGALRVVVLWLLLQYVAATMMTIAAPGLVERAIHDGFVYRGALAAWIFGAGPLPEGLLADPVSRLVEVSGVVVGTLATGGLVGAWFLTQALDRAAFATGVFFRSLEDGAVWRVLPYWTLLRLAGLGGLLVLLAEPLLTSRWSPQFYWRERRRLILVSVALLLAGLLLELFLPTLLTYPPAV
jgi:hypothetical protein